MAPKSKRRAKVISTLDTKVLVLGIGNLLQSDDGVGVHAVGRLREVIESSDTVSVTDGGTLGLELLGYLEGVSHLLVIDAIDDHSAPGSIREYEGDLIFSSVTRPMSSHAAGLSDLLAAAKLLSILPPKVVLLGIQPECVEAGIELSPRVAGALEPLVRQALARVHGWTGGDESS